MTSLDDPAAIRAGDPGGMLGLVAALGDHLRNGYGAAAGTAALPSTDGLRAVVVCGMGGSGVAGDVVRAVYAGSVGIPIVLVKGYGLPAFCDPETLVVASSFSGNTEETLAGYAEAVARGCRVVAVCSGGELAELSEADGVARVDVPSSIPVPRAALGHLAGALVGILVAMGVLSGAERDVGDTAALLDGLAASFDPGRPAETNDAKALVGWLGHRVPVIWGSEGIAETAATRWKTQFNENAKRPAFASTLPELDHNEIEGWSDGSGEPFAVIVLRHGGEHHRVQARLDATRDALTGSGLAFREVRAPTGSALASLFALVMAGDFASTYAAIARGVDPTPVPVLMALKARIRG